MSTTYLYKFSSSSITSNNRLHQLAKKNGHEVIEADPSEISKWIGANSLPNDTAVIGGGAAFAMYHHMSRSHKEQLKQAINGGVNYLGVCAGGFLGARNMNIRFRFERDCKNFTHESLDLLGVESHGPVFERFFDLPLELSSSERVQLSLKDSSIGSAYYCHGPYFTSTQIKSSEVIAKYETGQAAICSARVGKGRVTLSGVHAEFHEDDVGLGEDKDQLRERQNTLQLLLETSGLAAKV